MKMLPEHMPAKGNILWEFIGGPLDKLGWWIDGDLSPEQVIVDGHCYDRVVKTFREKYGDTDKYANDPDAAFEFEYRYGGKANHPFTVEP